MSKKLLLFAVLGVVTLGSAGLYIGSQLQQDMDTAQASSFSLTSDASEASTSSVDFTQLSPEELEPYIEERGKTKEEIKAFVAKYPDAGMEVIPKSTLDETTTLMKITPRFLIENELNSQKKEGLLTDKQYQEFQNLLDEAKGEK